MKSFRYVLAACLLLLGSWDFVAMGQENALVTGTITDARGAVVRNAVITLLNTATGEVATRTTNSTGIYTF